MMIFAMIDVWKLFIMVAFDDNLWIFFISGFKAIY